MRESVIETYLVDEVKAAGGTTRKVKWIGRNGAPDRLVLLPSGSFWVELKSSEGKCKPHQLREHEWLRRCGMRVEVISNFEQIDLLMKGLTK